MVALAREAEYCPCPWPRDAGAGAEQELDALDAAEEAARVEWRAAVVARQADVGARADEVRDARDVPLLARDVERARRGRPSCCAGRRRARASATIDTWPCRAAHVSSVSCFSVAPRAFTSSRSTAELAEYVRMSSPSASASPAATSEKSCTWVAVMARLRVMRPGEVKSVGVSVIIART